MAALGLRFFRNVFVLTLTLAASQALAEGEDDAAKKGERLVLAMEVGTLCNDENKKYKLKNGLCSGWEILEASYDAGGAQLIAKLQSTGGLRLVFGLLEE